MSIQENQLSQAVIDKLNSVLQDAYDRAPADEKGIRGPISFGQASFPNDTDFSGFANAFFQGGVAVIGDASSPLPFNGPYQGYESLADRAAVNSVPANNVIDVGFDTSTLDPDDAGGDTLGIQAAAAGAQFPTIVFAYTDAGLKVFIVLSVANGVAANSELTLIGPFGDTLLTSDTTNGGAVEVQILKLILQVNNDGMAGFAGIESRIRFAIGPVTTGVRKDDYLMVFDSNPGAVTINLPPLVAGTEYILIKSNSGGSAMTIVPDGSDTIDGQSSLVLTNAGDFVHIIGQTFAGSDWFLLANSLGTTAQNRGMAPLVIGPITYAVTAQDDYIPVDSNPGALTVDLEASPVDGRQVTISKINAGGGAVTVDGNGNNIDGSATFGGLSAQYDNVTLVFVQSASTGWIISK